MARPGHQHNRVSIQYGHLVSVADAAIQLGVRVDEIYRLARGKQLESIKCDGRVMIYQSSIAARLRRRDAR